MVAKAALPCADEDGLPAAAEALRGAAAGAGGAAPPGRHAGPAEETKPLLGSSRAPRMEAEVERGGQPLLATAWRATPAGHRKDVPGPDHVARLREQGEAPGVQDALLQNLGLGAQTADHWVRRYVRGGSTQKLTGCEEITQLDMRWAHLACVGLNADVKETSGSCRPCWTPGPGGPSARLWSTASSSATWPAGTGTSSRRTCAPTPPEQAKARLKELYPSKPGWPDTTLVISHSKRMAVNAAANRALAPEASKLLELEVIHRDLGENGCDK